MTDYLPCFLESHHCHQLRAYVYEEDEFITGRVAHGGLSKTRGDVVTLVTDRMSAHHFTACARRSAKKHHLRLYNSAEVSVYL